MIVWLNGPFGAGKTTTTRRLLDRRPRWRSFDPEQVGYLLREGLTGLPAGDFQDWRPWRTLVPAVLAEVSSFTGADVVAPQTVLVEEYWHDLSQGFRTHGLDVVHVVLDVQPDVLRARIRADGAERGAERWRLDHVGPYLAARPWLHACADLVVATDDLEPGDVAEAVLSVVGRTVPSHE